MQKRTFAIRGETRFKNARLVRAREELRMSCKEFAEHSGVSYQLLNAYENLRAYPGEQHRKALASFCDCHEVELFPPELQELAGSKRPRTVVQITEIEPTRLLGMGRREVRQIAAGDSPEREQSLDELKEELDEALDHLRPRFAAVIRRHFGLRGEPQTFEEIGAVLHISGTRAQQMETRGLEELRKYNRESGRLKAFLIEEVDGVVMEEVRDAAQRTRDAEARKRATRRAPA